MYISCLLTPPFYVIRRWRSARETVIGGRPVAGHAPLHDVRRVHNSARVPRDRHVADTEQTDLHHKATGKEKQHVFHRHRVSRGF